MQSGTRTIVALAALCAACEFPGARADQARAIPPAILFVRAPASGDGSAPRDGSEARPFLSLRAALAAAPAGALLRIDEGVFRESVVITRPVVLLGRGAGRTRIVASDPRDAVVQVRGTDHVQIHGVSIEGGAACAALAGGSHKLQRVELRDCTEAGLVGRRAQIEFLSSSIVNVSGGAAGRGSTSTVAASRRATSPCTRRGGGPSSCIMRAAPWTTCRCGGRRSPRCRPPPARTRR